MQTAVQDKSTLFSLLKANGQKLRSYGVSSMSVFGSFITGKFNADSDVDLLVDFDPKQKSYDNFMDLSFFLEDLLGRKVEVVTPQSLSKYIGPSFFYTERSQRKRISSSMIRCCQELLSEALRLLAKQVQKWTLILNPQIRKWNGEKCQIPIWNKLFKLLFLKVKGSFPSPIDHYGIKIILNRGNAKYTKRTIFVNQG
eukprot:gene16557-19673_t